MTNGPLYAVHIGNTYEPITTFHANLAHAELEMNLLGEFAHHGGHLVVVLSLPVDNPLAMAGILTALSLTHPTWETVERYVVAEYGVEDYAHDA